MKLYMLIFLILPIITLIMTFVRTKNTEISKCYFMITLFLLLPLGIKMISDIFGQPFEKHDYIVCFIYQCLIATFSFSVDIADYKYEKSTYTDEQTKLVKTLLDNLPSYVVYNFIKNMNRNEQIQFLKTVTIKEVTMDESREEEILEDGSVKRYFSITETPIIKTDADLEKWEPILRER